MSSFNINLHEAVYSLSDALDLVGITHIHHGKHVAYMSVECGKNLGWTGARLDDLFQAAMLHDSGVSKTAVYKRLAQFEWENDNNHCDTGADLLSTCSLLAHLAPIVRYHHTHWDVLEKMALPPAVKLSANCIYLVDRVDVLSLGYMVEQPNLLLSTEAIRQKILDKRGSWFAPELVDAFMAISQSEAFWLSLENDHVHGHVSHWLTETRTQAMSFHELRSIVYIFSYIVDAKSPYTKAHSDGVARLARLIGNLLSLSEASCDMLELAGLLHDLGKLRQPDELLDKPGELTAAESANMHRHSFDTYLILKNIHGLETIAEWAAQHHERVDGTGYPYHAGGESISLEARIVAVADVFQALAQKRPYRDSLPLIEIIAILENMVIEGKLDRGIVFQVRQNMQACWEAAVGMDW